MLNRTVPAGNALQACGEASATKLALKTACMIYVRDRLDTVELVAEVRSLARNVTFAQWANEEICAHYAVLKTVTQGLARD